MAAPAADGDGSPFAIHGQATLTEQLTAPFHAPYRGANSLTPRRGAETLDLTLYVGARLWSGAEAWVNPEIDQGFGLDDTLGVAGFPSGEAYKVGRSHPYWRLPRLFVRQSVDRGASTESVESQANQFGASRSNDRWVFTLGKFSVTDIFDANQYAHDPRADFMNWSAIDSGAFDYAADAWGFTAGAAAENYQGPWTMRLAVFELSKVPNSEVLEPGFHELQWVAEAERRYGPPERAGKLLLTVFDSRARMARLDDAINLAQATGASLDSALIAARRYQGRAGISLNLQQQLTPAVGLFARAGKAGGEVEAYEFSDIDQSLAAGLSVQGSRWGHGGDKFGIALLVNSISAARERFLNLGGLGLLVGDGRLPEPRAEQILESYYELALPRDLQLTVDYQYIIHPAFNSERGPVSVLAVRAHAQF